MSESHPKISVLIPSLNSQEYISKCLESVVSQSLSDLEIICIDAGSSDNTHNILKQFASDDSRIILIQSDIKSYGHQMNLGLDKACGEYIAIVESDDFIDKTMFEELYDLAINKGAEISKGTFYHFYDSNSNLEINDAKKSLNDSNAFNIYDNPIFLEGHPSIWAGIYKTSFLRDNGIKFVEEKGGGWVDNPFFYETAFAADKIVYTHEPYYYYRETNPNSSSNNLGDFTIPIRRMIENLDIVNSYGCEDEEVLFYVYRRAFAYISNIFRRDGYEEHMNVLRPYIQEMLAMLDEDIILNRFNVVNQETYYKFVSPLRTLSTDNSEVLISKKDYELMIKENNFLYKRINKLKKENKKLKSKNKDNNSEAKNKSLKKLFSGFKK